MRDEELDKLVASVTPERLRALVPTAWGTARRRGRTLVQVMALIDGLTAGMDKGEGLEYQQVIGRLRGAIDAAVKQMPDATYLPGS
jgi:hypothetical protein